MTNYKRFLPGCAALVFSLCTSHVDATVIHNEAIDGDLGYSPPPTALGTLSGVNTVIASLDAGAPGNDIGPDEFDRIAFTMTDTWYLDLDAISFNDDFFPALVIFGLMPAAVELDTPTVEVGGLLAAGSYQLSFVPKANIGALDYQISIRSAQAPEPSILMLLGIGLALTGVAKRKKPQRNTI